VLRVSLSHSFALTHSLPHTHTHTHVSFADVPPFLSLAACTIPWSPVALTRV
jgi:hypothetical protein